MATKPNQQNAVSVEHRLTRLEILGYANFALTIYHYFPHWLDLATKAIGASH